jgi:hypothetical protein
MLAPQGVSINMLLFPFMMPDLQFRLNTVPPADFSTLTVVLRPSFTANFNGFKLVARNGRYRGHPVRRQPTAKLEFEHVVTSESKYKRPYFLHQYLHWC